MTEIGIRKNEVQIYNDCCDCYISCGYDMTDPRYLSLELK